LRQTALVEVGAFNIFDSTTRRIVHTIALAVIATGVLTDLEKFGDPHRLATKVGSRGRFRKRAKRPQTPYSCFLSAAAPTALGS
jgi:hypothetical protein